MAYLLLREIAGALRKHSVSTATLFAREGLGEIPAQHLSRAPGRLGLAPERDVLGLELWLDGVAAKWD
eukprot:1853454-Lingulodinium_polyedra.AAC.1